MDLLLKYADGAFDEYVLKLKTIASFSKLFSESPKPYVHSRFAENVYSECFNATNVSRDDSTADAIYDNVGIGIKTFVNTSNQKIAEFNGLRPYYASLTGIKLARAISSFRNNRIDVTMRTYGLSRMIYHYTVRDSGVIKIFEEEMNQIDIRNIKMVSETNKKIVFTDGLEQYEFVYSKSTLYKKFNLDNPFFQFNVSIIDNPIDALLAFFDNYDFSYNYSTFSGSNVLVVPLYTENSKGVRKVWEKSGLNQWNAAGRKRHPNEVYINYPAKIRREHPDFFPHRDVRWDLRLPNGKHLSMKLCQDNEKAIMSDPNRALGEWILRDVLNLREGQLLTYEYLLKAGIDSVVFKKEDEGHYSVDFMYFEE